MNRNHMEFILLFLVLVLSVAAQAADFAGGTGEWDDPYQIATAEQLILIGSDWRLLDSHFVLIADIDLDPNLSADYAFQESPIRAAFNGVFDGQGHRIRHLTIRDTTEEDHIRCGLFGSIGVAGEVKRLVLEDVHVVSSSYYGGAGALCAYNFGVAFQCSTMGVVAGKRYSGGLVASNYGVVEECSSSCTVSGQFSGGLAGSNMEKVQDCYASGRVLDDPDDTSRVGGLVGDNQGTIIRCYAACQVESESGLSGGLASGAEGSMGRGSAEDSYFLDLSGEGSSERFGTPLTAEQMKERDNFDRWDFWETGSDDYQGPWYMPEGGPPELVWEALTPVFRSKGLPVAQACELIEADGAKVSAILYDYDHALPPGYMVTARPRPGATPGSALEVVSSLGPYEWGANPGNGTAKSPYLILSAGQLDCLAYEPLLWDRHFRLVSDIDLAGRIYARPLIGHQEWGGAVFEGTFDGSGHLVRNLTMEGCGALELGNPILGLFGEIGPTGGVKDLGLTTVSARGRGGRGGMGGMLCAVNGGSIQRCYCAGRLRGRGELGGLVGRNTGLIEACYARGDVREILDRNELCAGLVSRNFRGTIRTSYAVCSVPWVLGSGLVDNNGEGAVEGCVWDAEVSQGSVGEGGMGLTTEEMMSVEALQYFGWGGNPNWVLDDGNDYPRLIWEGTPGSLIPEAEAGF